MEMEYAEMWERGDETRALFRTARELDLVLEKAKTVEEGVEKARKVIRERFGKYEVDEKLLMGMFGISMDEAKRFLDGFREWVETNVASLGGIVILFSPYTRWFYLVIGGCNKITKACVVTFEIYNRGRMEDEIRWRLGKCKKYY